MIIAGGYPVFICWFFESVFFRREIFIFLDFEISSKVNCSNKILKLLVYYIVISLLIVFCVVTKFKFFFKSLKVYLQNLLVLRLVTCQAGSDWNLIVSSSVFCKLIKLPWFNRWSLWLWSVRWFFLGPSKTQGSGTRFFLICTCVNNFISFVSSWWFFFACFNTLISTLSWLMSCWYS